MTYGNGNQWEGQCWTKNTQLVHILKFTREFASCVSLVEFKMGEVIDKLWCESATSHIRFTYQGTAQPVTTASWCPLCEETVRADVIVMSSGLI